jgi:hypothetical protein
MTQKLTMMLVFLFGLLDSLFVCAQSDPRPNVLFCFADDWGRFAYEKAGGKFNQFSQNVTNLIKQGKAIEEAKAMLYKEVQGNFEAFLAERQSNQPFCYWFGPKEVHRKWVKGSGKAF